MNKVLFYILIVFAISCSHKNDAPLSELLVDSAIKITNNFQDTSRYLTAISLLNEAINLDSNNIYGYSNKLFYEESLGYFDSAITTLKKLIKLKRDSAELYFKVGFYNDLYGDTLAAQEYYQRSLPRYSIMLDTMAKNSPDRILIMQMLGMNVIMMGQEKILHDIMLENNQKQDTVFKEFDLFGKTRSSILDEARKKYIH